MILKYKWNQFSYSWKLRLSSSDINKIKWIWSEKKNKYYFKFNKIIDWIKYIFIWFKNWYIMIYEDWDINKKVTPVRNYYYIIREWVAYEVTPPIWIPF